MRTLRLIPCLILMLWLVTSVYAVPFDQGVYEFEDCGIDCTLSGTWLSLDNGAQILAYATGGSDYIEFDVVGQQLVIYRIVGVGFLSMDVCVNATCATVNNNNNALIYNLAYIVSLSGGTDTIRITGDFVYLDKFMILDAPGGGSFPTPVPTATAVPTSSPAPTATPASTTTPQPTPTPPPTATPQPTATPFELGLIWALDPASDYSMVNGQIVREDYALTAGDYVQIALLAVITGLLIVLIGLWLWKR